MTTTQELDERYGRARGRRLPWIVAIAIAIAIAVVIAFSWMTVAQSMGSVDADDLGYDVVDAHSVTVRFQITGIQGKDVVCAIQALDKEFGVVGWRILEIPATDRHSLNLSESITTVSEATTGLVNTCWVA